MTQYVTSAMTLADLASLVLNEYKEPVAGSTAMPLDTVYDAINATYLDIFNESEDDAYLREADYTFQTVADQTLNGAIVTGAATIVLTSSDNFPNATRSILIDGTDFVQYTANTVATETLSGVTGVDVNHASGETVQLGYPLSLITDIDEQEINAVYVNGLRHHYEQPSIFINKRLSQYRKFTLFESNLYIPQSTNSEVATIIYDRSLTLMTQTTHTPGLIPNKFREALLVSGAIMRIGVRDDMRTGFDWHEARYRRELKKFYAFANNRVKTKGPISRPSIYD